MVNILIIVSGFGYCQNILIIPIKINQLSEYSENSALHLRFRADVLSPRVRDVPKNFLRLKLRNVPGGFSGCYIFNKDFEIALDIVCTKRFFKIHQCTKKFFKIPFVCTKKFFKNKFLFFLHNLDNNS